MENYYLYKCAISGNFVSAEEEALLMYSQKLLDSKLLFLFQKISKKKHVSKDEVKYLLLSMIKSGYVLNYPNEESRKAMWKKELLPPLFYAAMSNDLEIMQLLLDNGANINECEEEGNPSFFYAVEKEAAEFLLAQKNIDADHRNKDDENVIEFQTELNKRAEEKGDTPNFHAIQTFIDYQKNNLMAGHLNLPTLAEQGKGGRLGR